MTRIANFEVGFLNLDFAFGILNYELVLISDFCSPTSES